MMHDEEQLLQPQQPNQTDEPGKQTLELARRIIARKNTQFILDHQNDSIRAAQRLPESLHGRHRASARASRSNRR